jgi:hypothetical protein
MWTGSVSMQSCDPALHCDSCFPRRPTNVVIRRMNTSFLSILRIQNTWKLRGWKSWVLPGRMK